MSIAATLTSCRPAPGIARRRRDPPPHRIVAAREMKGVVRVQALHAGPGPADAAGRARAGVRSPGDRRRVLGVARVRGQQLVAIDLALRPRARHRPLRAATPAVRVRRSTSQYRVGIGVPSSSSGALRITTGVPVRVADDDLERGARLATEEFGERERDRRRPRPPILGSGRVVVVSGAGITEKTRSPGYT